MANLRELNEQIDSDISFNVNLQNTIKKNYTLPLGIISIIVGLGISIFYQTLRIWLIISFLLWGVYNLYSLVNVFRKATPTIDPNLELTIRNRLRVFFQQFKPFQEACGLFFLINFIILLFIDIPYKPFLIVYSSVYVIVSLLFSISYNVFERGFDLIFKVANPLQFFADAKGIVKKIVVIFLIIFVVGLFFFGLFIAPLILIYVAIKAIILFGISYKLVLILLPIQLITLFFFVSFLGTTNALSKLSRQLVVFKELKDNLSRPNTVPRKEIQAIQKIYSIERSLKILPVNILKMDIWITFYPEKVKDSPPNVVN